MKISKYANDDVFNAAEPVKSILQCGFLLLQRQTFITAVFLSGFPYSSKIHNLDGQNLIFHLSNPPRSEISYSSQIKNRISNKNQCTMVLFISVLFVCLQGCGIIYQRYNHIHYLFILSSVIKIRS